MSKKIHAIIEARMSSERLPGKVMLKIQNKYILDILIDRVKKSNKIDKIIVSTTKNVNDNKISDFCKRRKILCFRGSERNVAKRVYDCAKKYNTEIIVQLTADNPLIDYKIINKCIRFYLNNDYDFVTNNNFGDFNDYTPTGMIVSIFKKQDLGKNLKFLKSQHLKEHSTLYFYREGKKKYKIKNMIIKNCLYNGKKPRLTLDYKEDFKVIKKIYLSMLKKHQNYFDYNDIIQYLNKNKKILKINSSLLQKKPQI